MVSSDASPPSRAVKGDGGVSASRAVDRVLTLLDVLSLAEGPMGIRELARSLAAPPAAVYRLLASLEQHRFVSRDAATGKYSLGSKVLQLSARLLERLDVRQVALPVMRELRDRCDETVSLYIVDGADRVCIERLESRRGLRQVISLGARRALHTGASGKLLLAYLPEDHLQPLLQRPLERFTENTVCDPVELGRQLESIRSLGFARSVAEGSADSASVAAPVWRHGERVPVAALTIVMPVTRFTSEREEALTRLVVGAAAEISRRMGAEVALWPGQPDGGETPAELAVDVHCPARQA